MAGQRYSRIVSASRYAKALDNYIKYVSGTAERQGKIGQGTKRPPSKTLYINPFALKTTDKQYAEVSASETAWNDHKANFTGYTKESLVSGTEFSLKASGYRAARVSLKTGASDSGTIKTSKVTGMKYLSYGGKSSSVPFGKKDNTDTESAVFDVIKGKFSGSSSQVSWIREKA
jgi:hypothetical protein